MKYHIGVVDLIVLLLKMDKLLRGVVKFSNQVRPSLLPTLEKLANKAQVQLFFSFFFNDLFSVFNIVIISCQLAILNFHRKL